MKPHVDTISNLSTRTIKHLTFALSFLPFSLCYVYFVGYTVLVTFVLYIYLDNICLQPNNKKKYIVLKNIKSINTNETNRYC